MVPSDNPASIASRLPGYHIEQDFLAEADHAALLEYSLASEEDYTPSEVVKHSDESTHYGIVNTETRRSGRRSLSERFRTIFIEGVRARQNQISRTIGVEFPAEPKFEIEAVHNGDGAFFSRHIDTTRGSAARQRVISAVYYYHAVPKRFSGGELELFSLDQSQSVVIEPRDNSMVFFPSIFFHEVLPVKVPSGGFAAGRFSVNCWVNRTA